MDWRVFFSILRLSLSGYTDGAVNALSAAWGLALSRRHVNVTPGHVLVGMAQTTQSLATLGRLGLVPGDGVSELVAPPDPDASVRCQGLGPEVRSLLNGAREHAKSLGSRYVGTEHLVLSLLTGPACPASDFLRRHGVSEVTIRAKLTIGPD